MVAILNFEDFSMPHLVGKVILHGFLWPFTFKLHFQYGRRRPSWILIFGLQKWTLHAKISRKSGITQLSISICFQITFPIWPMAAILDFGFMVMGPPDCTQLTIHKILQTYGALHHRQTKLHDYIVWINKILNLCAGWRPYITTFIVICWHA